jgi:hypothetical protein
MSQYDPSQPPDPSGTPGCGVESTNKRKHGNIHIPGASNQFPDLPWYSLNYQRVGSQIHEMLDEIILGLKKYVANDPAIKELIEAAEKAKKLPDAAFRSARPSSS